MYTFTGFNRRRVLVYATSLAGALALSGACQAADQVVLAGYGGSIENAMQEKVIPAFEKKTGIKVSYVVGTALSNYSKVVAARNSPEVDVYWSNGLTHVAGKQQNLYEKLDPGIVTNLSDVYDSAKDPDGIGVASYVLATGIEYNTKAYADAGIAAPKSGNDLWNPKLKGKVALYTFNVAYSQDLLVIMTQLAGGTAKDVQPGLDKLKSLKASGNLTTFSSTPAELDNIMVQGQSWVTVNGSARAFILKNQGAPIDFVFPKEGAGFFTNYFDVVKGAPHPKAAQALVDFLISPEAQAAIAESTVTAPINKKTKISDKLAAEVPNGDEIAHMIQIDRGIMNANLDKWASLWNRQIEGN
jgi:putative spermidine/putrescine transport system substrate-binding protein